MTGHQRPLVTADVVAFSWRDQALQVLLIKRANPPYERHWAIPGGFVEMDESLEAAARRELYEETGLADVYLEQLRAFGAPGRDPRGRVITVAYLALVPPGQFSPRAGNDAAEAGWWPINALPTDMAFDHTEILDRALARLRSLLQHTTLVCRLLPREFTLGEIQAAYEAILGVRLDRSALRRRLARLGAVEPTGRYRQTAGRQAQLYACKPGALEQATIPRLSP